MDPLDLEQIDLRKTDLDLEQTNLEQTDLDLEQIDLGQTDLGPFAKFSKCWLVMNFQIRWFQNRGLMEIGDR